MMETVCMKKWLICLCLLGLSALAHAGEQLDPALAFRPSLGALDKQTAEVRIDIADGAYLYRHRFAFKALTPGVVLGEAQIPAGHTKHDENLGMDVETHRGELRIPIPLKTGAAEGDLRIAVTYQGCADIGVCYPPETHELSLGAAPSQGSGGLGGLERLIERPAERSTSLTPPPDTPQSAAPPVQQAPDSEAVGLKKVLQDGHLGLILVSFFGAGLLLAFTPCVLPMLPILSGIVIGHDPGIGRRRAALLATVYVLGMALTYALIGVAAGLSGTFLKAALQNVWVLGAFALVFVGLAGAMFGFYELQLPSALQSRLSNAANRQTGGHFAGVAVMGVLSALIVGPCMAAPLAGALLYLAGHGDPVLGGLAMFVLGLGMGAPLIAIVSVARAILPKTGPWMASIRKVFGVIMLAMAVWLVTPVVPPVAVMLAWAVLAIVSAIHLHALDPVPPHTHGWWRLWKGFGVIALLWGAALIIGVLGGARDPFEPLVFLRSAASEMPSLRFEKVTSNAELDRRLTAGRPVMLDFYAETCTACKEMEREAFRDPRVVAALKDTVLLRADVTANSPDDAALLKRFGLYAPPAIVFFDAQGQEISAATVLNKQDSETFLATLQRRGQ